MSSNVLIIPINPARGVGEYYRPLWDIRHSSETVLYIDMKLSVSYETETIVNWLIMKRIANEKRQNEVN